MTSTPAIEIDGAPADLEALRAVVLGGYGHFTAMQVRDGRTRGLDLHLRRLDDGNRELFGEGLDGGRVRGYIRHALGATADASVRVYAYDAAVMVTVRPPGGMPATPQRLRSVAYLRPVPQVKSLGGFAQEYHRRAARRDGYDEILLTGPGGAVSEGGITNIGFVRGDTVVWPDAPCLAGITMQLLERADGIRSVREPVRLADLPSFDAAFVTNARGVAPVAAIDDVPLPTAAGVMAALTAAYRSARRDRV
jgi:branched-subunit amino acid aminotransferase/4-amino-4-deoxychorismate lyase